MITFDEIIAAVQEAERDKTDVVPDGWKTSIQIADESGKARCTVEQHLLRAVRLGVVERKQFRIATGRYFRDVLHYRIKAKP